MAELEQDELNERLAGADHVPIHHPAGASRQEESAYPFPACSDFGTHVFIQSEAKQVEEDDEEAQLKELQAALAM